MVSHESAELGARTDALVCSGAVRLLRARRAAGVAGEDPAVEDLLAAAIRELETDFETIPATIRRAIVQLAEHLVQRSTIPIPRGVVDEDLPAQGERTRKVAQCASMRLGRMG